MKHSDEQVNTRKEIESTPTQTINNAGKNSLQQKKRRMDEKRYTYFWGLDNVWAYKEKDVQKKEDQSHVSQEQKLKTCTTKQFLY